jgi:hypothetical protein
VDKQLLAKVKAEHSAMIAEMFTASVKDQLAFQRELALALKPPHRH